MGCRLFLIEGVEEGLSAADRWVYESHNQAPLLDNPGGGYIRESTRGYVIGTPRSWQ